MTFLFVKSALFYSDRMEENIVLVVDFDSVCRVCLQSSDAMITLFQNNKGIPLFDHIIHVTGLQITEDDGLPQNICYKCFNAVRISYELRNTAQNAFGLLVNGTSKSSILEYLDDKLEDAEKQTNKTDVFENKSQPTFSQKPDTNNLDKENKICANNKEDKSTHKEALKHMQCQICLSSFETIQQMRSHVAIHYTNTALTPYLQVEKPYECEICKTGRIRKSELISHHRKHLNVNPFVCKHPECDYVGKSQDTLRHHSITHGARTLVCEQCGAAFRRMWEVRQHTLRKHTARAPVACRMCRVVSRNPLAARTHVAEHHKTKSNAKIKH